MTFLVDISQTGTIKVIDFIRLGSDIVIKEGQSMPSMPYWPILLVVAILIPLMVVAFQRFTNK